MDAPHIVVSDDSIIVYDKYPWDPIDDILSWFVAESIIIYPREPEKRDE